MAFGFGIPGLGPASASPADDNALSPELLALLRARRLGAEDAPAPQGLALSGGAAGQGQGRAPPASRPFGFVSPLARAPSSDDEPAATPPGFSGFSPSPTPTGGAMPMLAAGLPSLGSVMKGMKAGARGSGETLTDTGQRIGAMVGDMAGRSADLIGKVRSGEIAPGAFLGAAARRAGETVRSAVTAPRDAYTGDLQVFDPATGHASDEAMGRAGAAAGLAMTGSLPFGVPAGALRTFGGRTAATADRAALDRAAGMQAAGAGPDAIWRDTGWGLGRDGAARFEIPDDAARLRPHNGAPATLLGSVLDHPALFDAYPGMRDVNVFHRPELGADAAANPARNWVALNLDDPQALQSLLHEGQHIVQRQEGFASGASPIDPAMAAHPQVAEAGALRRRLAGLDAPEAAALADRTDQAARLNAYRTAAGEVEARNVEARQGMTPIERRATPPWQTQDVPSDRQWLPRPAGDGVTGDAAQLRTGSVPAPAPAAPQRSAYPTAFGFGAVGAGGAALAAGSGEAQAASGSYADRVGHAESAGKATAKNPRSSATGYGQFIGSTWLDMMGRYRPDLAGSLPKAQLLALRNDPALSREMIARYGDENGAKLRAAGLPDNDGTRYLSHFAGPKGARAILKADPIVPAAQVLDPGQVSANPFVRKMTAGQLADWAAKKVGGSAPTMTMPDAPSRPAAFGLGGPTQVRAPASGTAPASPAPPAGPTSATPDIDTLLAVLAKNKGGGGGLGFASGGGGESRPEGDGSSILSRQAPRRRAFAFMRPMQFAGLETPIPQRRTTR